MNTTYITFYYNPKTGLYARKTRKNERWGASDETFNWKAIERLPKPQRTKVQLLDLCEVNQRVEGVGRRRASRVHKGFYQYFLLKDLKEQENE